MRICERIRTMTDPVVTLSEFFTRYPRWLVLTGAGISANSGIPTYRDSEGNWLGANPILHQEFLQSHAKRQRYWGRSMIGWPGVQRATPNRHHDALVQFERAGRIESLITQNVDRLHQRAGSKRTIDLHGRLDRVRCLDCGARYQREAIQRALLQLNPHNTEGPSALRPDGDADLSDDLVASITVPSCDACGGMLMPDVVFFGGAIPKEKVTAGERALEAADAMLVIGSSLQVYSGFRLCRQAAALGKPLLIANEGITRADEMATLKLSENALDQVSTVLEQHRALRSSIAPTTTEAMHE